jgi:serine palmitoyltransferase
MNATTMSDMASSFSEKLCHVSGHFMSYFAIENYQLPQLHSLLPIPHPSMHFLSSVTASDVTNLFSIRWCLLYIVSAYDNEPGHVLMEISCILCILYLLFRRPYDPKKEEQLSDAEEAKLIEEWQPAPLAPTLPAHCDTTPAPIVTSASGARVNFTHTSKSCLNFCSSNFLGLASHDEVLRTCASTIEKYGVGSCGPRGFYGSFDVHLELESAISHFYNAESCILYSDGLACLSSILPAFAKRGDLIISDSMCNYAIQQGIRLSRSNALYFT